MIAHSAGKRRTGARNAVAWRELILKSTGRK